MNTRAQSLVIIPARMASTRLPGKPLAEIGGKPMIVRVMERAAAANCGPVYVACAEEVIKDAVEAAGGKAILTDPDLPSGTDRIRVAADIIDPDGDYDVVINVQGDLPTLDPKAVSFAAQILADTGCDISTLAVATTPSGDGPVYHHVGLYAYRRAALSAFCKLPPSPLERRERLEQLRALEAGMTIYAGLIDSSPEGVDTPEDLARARDFFKDKT